ncbi:hypothetical protein OH77DRAFT_1393450 [Trametes cingulata]|nr:hypothetical protein OH77DRAFT_1393450 [Trametes cingulata]
MAEAGPINISSRSSMVYQDPEDGSQPMYLLHNARLQNQYGVQYGHILVSSLVPLHTAETVREHTVSQGDIQVASVLSEHPQSTGHQSRKPPPLTVLWVQIGLKRLPFVLDTGSQVDCIRTDSFRKFGGTPRPMGHWNRIINAAGQELTCRGVWRTPIIFGNIQSTVDLHIVDEITAPGILGQPWQRLNQAWIKYSVDGMSVGARSPNGLLTYEVLISSPQAQEAAWQEATTPHIQEHSNPHGDIPIIDFSESHVLQQMMDPVKVDVGVQTEVLQSNEQSEDESRNEEDTEENEQGDADDERSTEREELPAPVASTSGKATLTSTPLEVDAWMYRQLLIKHAAELDLERSVRQPQVEDILVHRSDRFDLKEGRKFNISEEEDLFLLRNIAFKVGDETRYGHGVLHVCYFPPPADGKDMKAEGKSSLAELKRKRPRIHYRECMDAIEEVTKLHWEPDDPYQTEYRRWDPPTARAQVWPGSDPERRVDWSSPDADGDSRMGDSDQANKDGRTARRSFTRTVSHKSLSGSDGGLSYTQRTPPDT